jgi:hypothetical protein
MFAAPETLNEVGSKRVGKDVSEPPFAKQINRLSGKWFRQGPGTVQEISRTISHVTSCKYEKIRMIPR